MNIFLAILLGISLLLILILRFKIQAFLSLLISSIVVGLLAGLNAEEVIETVIEGMGSTLGYVATVIGLGVIFGSVLEHSGGAKRVAGYMLNRFGVGKAPYAMAISGFIVAIPVFFEVAFIILVPILYSLQKQTGKSLLLYAIPLLAGLAVTHAFIPPTPGPIAVASIIGADLGWVILFGAIAGLPTALISGILFGRYISKRIQIDAPEDFKTTEFQNDQELPSVMPVLSIIGIPIILILINTTFSSSETLSSLIPGWLSSVIELVGHPIPALVIANLIAWYFLGIRRGFSKDQLAEITRKSMMPAGAIILLTGAGGVFKQVLVDTGAGTLLAETLSEYGIPLMVLAFLSAVAVRLLQGSATVAMITAASLIAPFLTLGDHSQIELAVLVISIAAGASTTSHVNDSGFWLVSQYLGLSEKETLRSWTVMTTILALTGFIIAFSFYLLFA